jgi:hypothetical protein
LSSRLLSRYVKVKIYKTVIHGCETWSLTLRKEHRLRVFENRVPRRIGMRDEVTGEWRKLHNEKLHNLYPSPDVIRQVKSRRMMWAGHVARMGEERKVYKILVGKPKGKRPLGRPRRRWEDGIRMDLGETGLGGCELDSTSSGQRLVAGCCECGDEPSGSCATELVSHIRNQLYELGSCYKFYPNNFLPIITEAKSEVLMMVKMTTFFLVVTLCILVGRY